MQDDQNISKPAHMDAIVQRASDIGFAASCDLLTGNFVRLLAAAKPAARILELGTGAGFSTSWILDGMDEDSTLVSVEMDEQCSKVAQDLLGADKRVRFIVGDGGAFIESHRTEKYDLIYADTWPGKFYLVQETLEMVKPGGLYFIDDLNPQPNWPDGHGEKVKGLIAYLESRDDFYLTKFNWSTGLILMTRRK